MPLRKMAAKQTITISQRKISAKDTTRSRIDSESRQATINHTASVQYYSNKNNRKSQDEPIINVTSKADLKPNELQEGMKYLQNNLQSLESKYQDIASLYYHEQPSSFRSPNKNQLKQVKLKRPASSKPHAKRLDQSMSAKPTLDSLFESYKSKLQLSQPQTTLFYEFKDEVLNL